MDFKFDIIQNGYTVCPDTWGMTDECAVFYRIYYVKGGKAWMQKDGRETPLEKEHLYVFPVMQPYTLRHDKKEPLEVLWFHVEMDISPQTGFCDRKIEPGTAMYHLLNAMVFLHREEALFSDIASVFGIILKEMDSWFHFFRNTPKRMQKVLTYIEEHIRENPRVTELARCAGMERSYFSRLFKEHVGLSPRDFVYARKMSVGAKALLEGKTVEQAAFSCGYSDEKAFSRAFRKYMEVSPGAYRKCHIEQP